MAYSDPRTWATGELVTAALMNAQLRDNLDAVIEGTTGAYVNSVVGPHAIGGSTVDYVRLGLTGGFTSGGASTVAFGTYTSGVLTGHSADSAAIAGVKLNNTVVTAGNCTTIAQLWVSEPQITVGSGAVTNSAPVYIEGAASEASNDYALWVDAGATKLDGTVTTGSTLTVGTDLTVTEDLVVSAAGPHAIGGATVDYTRLGLTGNFTSGGASDRASGTEMSGVLTGHSADSVAIAGTKMKNSVVTAGNCTTIAQLWVEEPTITVGSGTVTNSATGLIDGAATEATNDYALWVNDGVSRFDANVTMAAGAKLMLGSETSGAGGATVPLQINGTSGANSGMQTGRFSGDSGSASFNFVKSRSGTVGGNRIVSASDGLGSILWYGDDGTDYASTAAEIKVVVGGTPGSNDMPGNLVFSTTPDGSVTLDEVLNLYQTGVSRFTGGVTTGLCDLQLNNGQISLADGATVEISVNTGALIMVSWFLGSGGAYYSGLFWASYASSTIIELGDPNGNFEVTDTGSGYALYKGVVTSALYIKNRTGGAKNTAVNVIHSGGN